MRYASPLRRILSACMAVALMLPLLLTAKGTVFAAAEQEIVFIDPSSQKEANALTSTDLQLAVKNVSELGETAGEDEGVPDGSAYFARMVSSRAGIAKENLALDTSAGSGTLEAWVWISDSSKVDTFVIRLYENNLPTVDGSTNLRDGYKWQWNSRGDINTNEEGMQSLHSGWNQICVSVTGLAANTNAIMFYENNDANNKRYDFAVASAILTIGEEALTLIDPSTSKSVSDLREISSNKTVLDTASLTGGTAGVPAGTAYYTQLMEGKKSGTVLNGLNLDVSEVNDSNRSSGSNYRLEAWIWISDASKVKNFVIRFYQQELSVTNDLDMDDWTWQRGDMTSAKYDIDDTQPGDQYLQTGWNLIRLRVDDKLGTQSSQTNPSTIRAISFHEHDNGIYNFAVASVKFVKIASDATLTSLQLSNGTLSPAFDAGTTVYTAAVPNAVESITVTPTLSDTANSTVAVNGVAVDSGTASEPITLEVGENVITVIGKAADDTVKNYTITVTRAAAGLSTDASLSSLELSSGTLNPAFDASTFAYTATVPNETASLTVTPTASDASGASITVNGTQVASGAASGALPLAVGANTVTIGVVAEDGATIRTYTVTVTREVPKAVGPDADGNYVAFEAEDAKAADELTQTNPSQPTTVTVVNNATLTGGIGGAPATGTAYQVALPVGGVKSGVAVEHLAWDASSVQDSSRFGTDYTPYKLDVWFHISDVSQVGNLVFRVYKDNLRDNGSGGWVDYWTYQFGDIISAGKDIDDDTVGTQSLQTGWNHLVKYVENLSLAGDAAYQNPSSINAIAIEDHAGAKGEYSLAIASIALIQREADPDASNWPLTELDDTCDSLNDAHYFYEIYKDGLTVGSSAVLGAGQDGSSNGAIWFEDVPLRGGWIARYGTKSNTILLSATESSQLTFWIYVSDVNAISSTLFELGSTNNADQAEKEWNFKNQLTTNGWNQVTLDFSDGVGSLTLNEIRRYRVALLSNGGSGTVDIAIDSIKLSGTGDAVIEDPIAQDDSGFTRIESDLNYDFDELDDALYQYDDSPIVDTTEKKEGDASLKWVSANGSSGTRIGRVYTKTDAFDFSIDDMNGYIGFWFYASDADKIQQLAFELATTGQDQDEYEWHLQSQIKADGWNYIIVPLSSPTKKTGENFDSTHIRHWRIFALGNGGGQVEICIDDLSLLKKEFGDNTDPDKQFNYDCDTLNTAKYVYEPAAVLDTDAQQGDYSIRFTAPNSSAGTAMRIYNKTDMLNFAIPSWRSTYVSFWVYVNDPELITKAAFEISSLGIDATDEFEYDFTAQLTAPGWSMISIPLMTFDSGTLNLEHITSSRIYMLGNGNGSEIIVKLDDIRLQTVASGDDDIDWGDVDWGDTDQNEGSSEDDNLPNTGDTTHLPLALTGLTVGAGALSWSMKKRVRRVK